MTHETTTSLDPADIIARAKYFLAERVPHHSAFIEREGPNFATFRGQGGEELTIGMVETPEGTRVRASTLFFDQVIGRFFSTLPAAGSAA